MSSFLKIFCLLLCFVSGLFVNRADAEENNKKEELLSKLRKQHMLRLSVGNLSKKQKQHLRIYWEINGEGKAKDYSSRQIYKAMFKPVLSENLYIRDLLLKASKKCENQAIIYMEQGNNKLAILRSNMAKKYKEMAEASLEIEKNYALNSFSKMYEGIDKYVNLELELKYYKLKVPKREWLTNSEARKLISEWKKSKQYQGK